MSRQWPFSLALCLVAALHVAGQSSNVTTCVSNYAWSLNSKKQTPCLIAAYLESLCGVPTSVDAIPVGTHYLGPASGQSDPCKCSSVTYSAVSACGGCQGRTFQNWTAWSGNCVNAVEVASFPKLIPSEVEVPAWMYINITLIGNNFDPIMAQKVQSGAPTPSTSVLSISSTSSSSTDSATILPATQTPESTSQQGASKKSNAGAIAGGTIAGLIVLAIIGLYILWYIVKKRRNAIQKDFSFDSKALVAPAMSQQFTGSTGFTQPMSMSHTTSPDGPSPIPFGGQSIYDPNSSQHGHSAYPLSPVTSSGVYTSPEPGRRSLESVSPSLMQLGGYQNPSQARGYRGAAELS